ncbi:MAG: hybrid sensor histidine kinase/response regulator [bacterium]
MDTKPEAPAAPQILIVDDMPSNLQLLAGMLKLRGYSTSAALSGKLALQSIKNHPPDLILLDVNMPDIDGFEVCRQLKADPMLADIPVIFVSGLHETSIKTKAFSAGGVDFIDKPFQIDEVIARVTTHLHLRKQRLQLQDNLKHLRALEELRDTMVHMIVHDLRNPAWGITCYLELIKKNEASSLSPTAGELINEALAYSTQMMEMINTILDVNKMDAGLLKLTLSSCDLESLCRQVAEDMGPRKGARTLIVESQTSSSGVKADTPLIKRVITKLVTHALRATPDEGGRIQLRITSAKDCIRVTVEDNGRPIPAHHHGSLFDKYAPAEAVIKGESQYSPGLGLSFCKLAVEAHGGRIGVQSEPGGQGNQFWFELPTVPTTPV